MTSTGNRVKKLPLSKLVDKRILLTCCWLSGWGGGELNILQLAKQLKDFGMKVECFTYWFNGPMVDAFNEAGIKVFTDSFNHLDTEDTLNITDINLEDYDYVWVCQQVVPISIVRQLQTAKYLPRFIFLHMSALLGIPVEAPIVWNFEKRISDKTLSISEDVTVQIQRILGQDFTDITYYRNPAPVEYSSIKSRSGKLRRIAVISSHPPEELIGVEKYIKEAGIQIDYIGSWNGNFTQVDEKILDKYDLVVGIGKNVQYCLVSGIPVYVYDYFGGCGYLDEGNYEKARNNNFSGRGFSKKDAITIAKEIQYGYNRALDYHDSGRNNFCNEYRIDHVLDDVFSDIPFSRKPNSLAFSDEYVHYLESMQIMLHDRFIAWGGRRLLQDEVNSLNKVVLEKDEYLTNLRHSRSYRIGNALMRPMSAVKKLIKSIIFKKS